MFDEILIQSSRESFNKVYSKVHGNVSNNIRLMEDVPDPFKKNKGLLLSLVYCFIRKFNLSYIFDVPCDLV